MYLMKGTSGSEGNVRKSLVDIIAGCPKMVVVTTFASNLARLDTIIHAGTGKLEEKCLSVEEVYIVCLQLHKNVGTLKI